MIARIAYQRLAQAIGLAEEIRDVRRAHRPFLPLSLVNVCGETRWLLRTFTASSLGAQASRLREERAGSPRSQEAKHWHRACDINI
jgi:hypothetical protein